MVRRICEPVPIMDFTQAQAAKLSKLDERNFRVLVDEGSVLPTSETKDFKRGKAKLYSRNEVRIASILNALNLRSKRERTSTAKWIQESPLEKAIQASTEDKPIYIIVGQADQNRITVGFQQAAGIWIPGPLLFGGKESERKMISVMVEDGRPIKSFVAANINEALWWNKLSDDQLAKELDPNTELDRIFEGLRS